MEREKIETSAEMGERSMIEFTCPRCESRMSVYSDGYQRVICDCGFGWEVSISATGHRWTEQRVT